MHPRRVTLVFYRVKHRGGCAGRFTRAARFRGETGGGGGQGAHTESDGNDIQDIRTGVETLKAREDNARILFHLPDVFNVPNAESRSPYPRAGMRHCCIAVVNAPLIKQRGVEERVRAEFIRSRVNSPRWEAQLSSNVWAAFQTASRIQIPSGEEREILEEFARLSVVRGALPLRPWEI